MLVDFYFVFMVMLDFDLVVLDGQLVFGGFIVVMLLLSFGCCSLIRLINLLVAVCLFVVLLVGCLNFWWVLRLALCWMVNYLVFGFVCVTYVYVVVGYCVCVVWMCLF